MLFITPTDRQVLRLLAQGKPVVEIADCLGIDPVEVGLYLTSLFSAIGASGRTEAIRRALQRGLLAPDV
jgi:DNA-binding CsgD family transcriptional regulator